ncbi:MAG: hypothetical protein K6A42_00315 [Treponema sp.]|nr:hypothetical protein [Treponema sp.]
MKANQKIKSGVFADLFCDDEKDGKKNFLSLYNAIHGTNLTLENTKLERKQIPQAIYKTFDTDISVLVNGRLFVLIEHQSTPNENIPLRCLEYYVHLLYGIVPARFRYREPLYKIPAPEFYVFYNGRREQKQKPERERTMRLSDAFIEPQDEPTCEVEVKFANIGGEEGKNLPVVQNCAIMKEYCEFMEIVAHRRSELGTYPPDEALIECYDKAISEAISKGILVDYLSRKATEVRNMFVGEYDYDTDIKVHEEVAREQKALEDARNFLNEGIAPEVISRCVGLPLEQVLELQKEPIVSSTDKQ